MTPPSPTAVASRGLTSQEAARRLVTTGPNAVPDVRPQRLWRRVAHSLSDPLVLVLLGAVSLTIATQDFADAIVIGAVVVVNTVVAVRQEVGADRALAALRAMGSAVCRVIRDDTEQTCPVVDLVPGDLVLLAQGDLVPADGEVVDSVALRVDESTLTGESVAVDKMPGSLVLSGTAVVHGRATFRVDLTGVSSASGQIGALLTAERTVTPLQRRMARLSVQLAVVAAALCTVVLLTGWWRGQSLELMLLTAVSLAVAAVPESLPAVVTVSLSLAARRMAHRKAVVRNLAAVETLGSVTLLATDKTGTLTQARMSVVEWWSPDGADRARLSRAVRLCNDAYGAGPAETGDPTEIALLRATAVTDPSMSLAEQFPRIAELPFDSERKRMTTVHRSPGGGSLVVCKGAPEMVLLAEVLNDRPEVLAAARARARELATAGLRVLAVAERQLHGSTPAPAPGQLEQVEHGLALLGLVAMQDPPRDTARATLQACHDAGIRVTLVTGDHALTAARIAEQVGIGTDSSRVVDLSSARLSDPPGLDVDVIARATPSDKVEAVRLWQEQGHVVAMTGDGVNDGPALRRADIGVAMGGRGSEVARQAADLVLRDDELGTLVAAVEEGRRVYDNIRRFLLYGLSGGAAEILVMLAGPFLGTPLPLLPGQILWVNLVTHSLTGTALGSEPVEVGSMTRPPRDPREGVLGAGLWWRVVTLALVVAGAGALAATVVTGSRAQSVLMLGLSTCMLGVAIGSRVRPDREARRFWRPLHRPANPVLPIAVVASTLLLLAAVGLPPLQHLLGTRWPGAVGLAAAAGAALVGFAATHILRRAVG